MHKHGGDFFIVSSDIRKRRNTMFNAKKYTRQFFEAPKTSMKWAQKAYIDHAPQWCSVDLRDGNQALIIPMGLGEKLEYFQMLVDIGLKEIEIGFPAASETEYDFCRTLIEQDLIPDDVTIQVLTQSREHIIQKTFEALKGCKNAIVHLYNSTSAAQREQVFRKSREEITEIAVYGAKLCKEYREKYEGNFRFEYSPESFTGTEPEYALEICNAVLDVWQPTADRKAIINIPESYYPLVKQGMKIDVRSEIYPDKVFPATIEIVYPTIDPSTHTFQAKLNIPNSGEKIRPGMYVKTTLALGEMDAIVVPYQSVLKLTGSNDRYVFTNQDGTAHRVAVTLGQRFDDRIEIIPVIPGDIKEGDQLIVTGQARLVDGSKLEIVK